MCSSVEGTKTDRKLLDRTDHLTSATGTILLVDPIIHRLVVASKREVFQATSMQMIWMN